MKGCGEIAFLEVDEQAFELASALAHQSTFEAVETATDDAYLLAIELGRDLVITEILHIVGLFDSIPELLKILGSHGHRLKLLAATHITVLQQVHLADNGVELFLGLMHEDKIGHEGNKAHHTFAKLREHMLFERHEHAILHLRHRLQLLVGGPLGVWTCQIAQHIPTVFHDFLS